MKITKSRLKKIIKEEMHKYNWDDADDLSYEDKQGQAIADELTDVMVNKAKDIAAEKFNFEPNAIQNLELAIEEAVLDAALLAAKKIIEMQSGQYDATFNE